MLLTVLVHVLDEVGLALELPRQLGRLDEAQGPLLALNGLVAFHDVILWRFVNIIGQVQSKDISVEINCGIIREIHLTEAGRHQNYRGVDLTD